MNTTGDEDFATAAYHGISVWYINEGDYPNWVQQAIDEVGYCKAGLILKR